MTPNNDILPLALDAAQAAELLVVADLEARWSNLRKGETWFEAGSRLSDLQVKQRAYESFRSKLLAFQSRFKQPYEAEPLLGNPVRLASWCRGLRDLCRRAEGHDRCPCPTHVVEKAYRIADRLAARGDQPPARPATPSTTLRGASEDLDGIAQWCDALPWVARRPVRASA